MRDINARDIINSPITEVIGVHPSREILEQSGEKLAEAENNSRTIVRYGKRKRVRRAFICGLVALLFLTLAIVMGYFWLFKGGKVGVSDLVKTTLDGAVGALISTAVCAVIGLVSGGVAYGCRRPSDAEKLNSGRLDLIAVRWDELEALGISKAERRSLRRRAKSGSSQFGV